VPPPTITISLMLKSSGPKFKKLTKELRPW
jgi:hypothetical protein